MALYTNNTRFAAIVTLKIGAVVDAKDAVKIGLPSSLDSEKVGADPGFHDFLVRPNQVLELAEGTQAELIAVRSAP